jgi:drug/metabolite transporter (DMT)-like permease
MARSWGLILVAVVLAVGGQLFLKQGMNRVGPLEAAAFWTRPVETLARLASRVEVVAGMVLYAFSAAAWLVVLSQMDLSYAYPLLALMYVLVPLASRLFLGEQIPPSRWAGIVVVCAGVYLVSRG